MVKKKVKKRSSPKTAAREQVVKKAAGKKIPTYAEFLEIWAGKIGRLSKIPKTHLGRAYMRQWPSKYPTIGSDKIGQGEENKARFRRLLPKRYHNVDLSAIHGDLVSMRKAGELEPTSGRKGPQVGNVLRKMLDDDALLTVQLAYGIAQEGGKKKAGIVHLSASLIAQGLTKFFAALGDEEAESFERLLGNILKGEE